MKATEMESKPCCLCKIPIESGSNVTKLSCGHEFHARCAHGPLARNFAYCPACVPPESADVISTREETRHNPLDFGDDVNVQSLLEQRLILIKRYEDISSRPNADAFSVAAVRDHLSRREKEECEAIHGSSVDELAADENSNWMRTFQDMASMAFASAVDGGTNEAPKTSELDECMENTVDFLVSKRTPSEQLVTKHGVDIHVLIRMDYTLHHLLDIGYGINDLVYLNTTWTDMRSLNFKSTTWASFKEKLPVKMIVDIWKIKIADVYVDVCDRSFDNIMTIGFTHEEFILLGASTIDSLIEIGMTRKHLKAMKWEMMTWKKFGMTETHIAKFEMDSDYLSKNLHWTDTDEKLILFKSLFGIDPAKLEKRNEKPTRKIIRHKAPPHAVEKTKK